MTSHVIADYSEGSALLVRVMPYYNESGKLLSRVQFITATNQVNC